MRRIAIVLGSAAVALVVMALPAAAHVTVQPGTASKGGFATVAFQVPNEDPSTKTTKVEVQFPPDSPIPFVSVEPVPGWTFEIATKDLDAPVDVEGTEITKATTSITWTAEGGGGIGANEFQAFRVSMGPLPDDVDELLFPATQTSDNGDEVDWVQETPDTGEEPEHPAPVLTLEESEEGGHGGETETTTATTAPSGNGGGVAAAAATGAALKDAEDSADSAQTLAIVALIVGIVGVGVGIGGVVMARRRA